MTDNNIIIDGAQIWARNFSGKEGKFNAAGNRNFNLWLDPKMAGSLKKDGWNVKEYAPKSDPDAEPRPFIKVAVNYNYIPPKIYRVGSNNKKVLLDEDNVGNLDWEEIKNVRIVVRPYHWEVNGKEGIKAYVKTMYVEVEEDPFENRYASGDSSFPSAGDDEELPFI